MRDAPASVYTIPPDLDFTRTLAEQILTGQLPRPGGPVADPLSLINWTILVPTRRAARALTMAFAADRSTGTRLLPRIRPLGDIDDDELAAETVLGGLPELDIAPAIAPLQRQFVLARLILQWAHNNPASELSQTVRSATGQALDLARSLGKLIDGFDNDEVSLAVIKDLFDADLPEHRADVLEFLDVVRVEYPLALAGQGLIGATQRRSALIHAQAGVLEDSPPSGPVIAAGSTGSIPATAELLKQICRLPNGAVVLPGLDMDMDDASWAELEAQHPQFGLKELLEHLGVVRGDVSVLADPDAPQEGAARRRFMSEAMRPSATSERWHDLAVAQPGKLAQACQGMTWIEAPDQHSEAIVIAMLM
ncbi:MAG: double-strand break repair protein AddB, partial [Aestuariivirgaceae bacterium]